MFLTLCSPISLSGYGNLSRIWSRTVREMQIPPGSASASSRAATLTPSPKDVSALGDDIAEVDADAQPDPPLVRRLGLPVDHPALHLGGAAHRVDDAGKFH